MIALRDELFVLGNELSLAAPDPLHVRLELLDLVNLALATVAGCHLPDRRTDEECVSTTASAWECHCVSRRSRFG